MFSDFRQQLVGKKGRRILCTLSKRFVAKDSAGFPWGQILIPIVNLNRNQKRLYAFTSGIYPSIFFLYKFRIMIIDHPYQTDIRSAFSIYNYFHIFNPPASHRSAPHRSPEHPSD
jgi:hypothetical protein